jgi:hypothetical protein
MRSYIISTSLPSLSTIFCPLFSSYFSWFLSSSISVFYLSSFKSSINSNNNFSSSISSMSLLFNFFNGFYSIISFSNFATKVSDSWTLSNAIFTFFYSSYIFLIFDVYFTSYKSFSISLKESKLYSKLLKTSGISLFNA